MYTLFARSCVFLRNGIFIKLIFMVEISIFLAEYFLSVELLRTGEWYSQGPSVLRWVGVGAGITRYFLSFVMVFEGRLLPELTQRLVYYYL